MKKLITLMLALAMTAGVSAQQKTESDAAIKNIMTRTSVRKYTNEAVTKADIETMLRAGMAAPTAVNKQPWHFVVVTDREQLNALAAANRGTGMAAKAPLAIVVCGDMQKTLSAIGQGFWVQDCSAATENILLAANALGLGGVWTGLYPNEERANAVRDVLKAPEHIVPLCVIVIGHPAETPTPKDKWKPENVSYNKFGEKAK
jgi:nitroreductase